MTLLAEVVAALVALGHGTALGTDIFAFRWPISPVEGVCIIPLGGGVPDEIQGSRDGVDYPGFQIQVRKKSSRMAYEKAEEIRLDLNGTDAGEYTIFSTRSSPVDITSSDDLQAGGGPFYRFSVDFETLRPR